MAKKNSQIDLEEAINQAPPRVKAEPGKRYETADAFTGEIFQARTPEHYERVDPVPVAPPVDLPRPTLRQRVENLLNREPNVMARFIGDDTTDQDYDIPDDPDAPLTPSEQNYIDLVASDLAESAPLPDEGLPRQQSLPNAQPQGAGGGEGEAGGSPNNPPQALPHAPQTPKPA